MSTDSDHTEDDNGSNSTNLAKTTNFVRGALDRLEADDHNCPARVDETGRFWLQDPENNEAYLWTRQTIDVEVVR